MKRKIFIKEEWRELLNSNGLKDFDSFFKANKNLNEIAFDKNGKVYKFEPENSEHRFYLKIKFTEQKRKIVRSILRGKGYKNPLLNEVLNIEYLKSLKFPTPETIAWGVSTNLGISKASFIMTKEVKGEEFIDLYLKSSSQIRRKLYFEYGRFLGLIHKNNIDSYIRIQDLICNVCDDGTIKLTLIDREVGSRKPKKHTLPSLKRNLSHVFFEGLKRYEKMPITCREAFRFCDGYLSIRKDFQMKNKELFTALMDETLKFISKRKSFSRLAPILPHNFLNWPELKRKHLTN